MSERPISVVPRAVLVILACAFALHALLRISTAPPAPIAADLPPAPSIGNLQLASLGDPLPLAKVLMLYLQAFDLSAQNRIPYQSLSYSAVQQWLLGILSLDPKGQYPLMAAARLYAEIPNESKSRMMLDFVYRQFFVDPNRRWPWLAHAAAVAKHRLKDLPLARQYAEAIQKYATGPNVPEWARQMEIFILEDMDELETARIMIGGMLSAGAVTDPAEARFLEQRLKEIEARLKNDRVGVEN